MIESKQQLVENFRARAQAFLANPSPLNGIEFDDAAVTLKRYVLSELHDQALGSTLARFQKLIRAADVVALQELLAQVEDTLSN